jgi:hypothetical protein
VNAYRNRRRCQAALWHAWCISEDPCDSLAILTGFWDKGHVDTACDGLYSGVRGVIFERLILAQKGVQAFFEVEDMVSRATQLHEFNNELLLDDID